MGLSASSQEEIPLALPQQHIVSVAEAGAARRLGAQASATGCVGRSQEAVAVRAIFTIARAGLRLEAGGSIACEFSASADGVLELLLPAMEQPGRGAWPIVETMAEKSPFQRNFQRGEHCVVKFDRTCNTLREEERREALVEHVEGYRRWPIVFIFRPGSSKEPLDNSDPPNGCLMVCCIIRHSQLQVARQLIAWGGKGAAYEMKELYGIQEVQASSNATASSDNVEVDGQKNCVVCLTAVKDTALLPCGHFCVCYECGAALRLAPTRNRCPLCRKEVRDIARIDVASPLPEAPAPPPAEAEEEAQAEAAEPAEAPLSPTSPVRVPEGAEGASLPPRCLQRLTREMRQIEEQRAKHRDDHGLELSLSDPAGSDLRTWSLRLFTEGIDSACNLGRELRTHSISAVELEIWIPDAFPVQPPRLRVIKPCFATGSFFVFQHGALCLEILTTQGWTPAMSLPQLGVQVKAMMSQGKGTVSSCGNMGDPSEAGRESAWSTFERIESSHTDWRVFSVG